MSLAERLSGFAVEGSTDGRTWTTVWQQATDDERGLGVHHVTVPQTAATFYRLRSDFVDGLAEYSEVAFAPACDAAGTLVVWPNPTRGELYLMPIEEARTFTLTDATGRVVRRVLVPGGVGELSINELTTGLYLLSDATGGRVRVVVR